MGRFDARATSPLPRPQDMVRWRVTDPLRGRGLRRPLPIAAGTRPFDPAAFHSERASLTWIGHASFLMRMGGALIAFDPVLSTRLRGFVPRLAPPGISRERFPAVDYVLVSHNHFDHLDLPSLPYMGRSATYVVPLGMGALLSPIGPKRVVELDWWQSHRDGSLEITLVPARHWSMRSPWDRNDSLWGGFVVRADEGAAYHAGDTAHFDGFRDIRERVGPIDWAMLPIGAYEPRWFMKPQHMDPDEALDAFTALGAKNFVAMHWGTFLLTDEPTHEPPARVRQGFVDRGVSVERLWVMDIGETRPLVTT